MGTDQLEQTGTELWEQVPGGPQLGQIPQVLDCGEVQQSGEGVGHQGGTFRLLAIAIYEQDGTMAIF